MTSIETRALRWALGSKTGASSKAILQTMIGDPPKGGYCYPQDAGDFGRCVGLLDAVPEYRARLDEMKAIGPEWAALVSHWPALEALWRGEDNIALYRAVQELVSPLEKKRPGLVRIGPNAAIYFGRKK